MGPISLPEEAADIQDVVLDAAAELFDLLLNPLTLIKRHGAHNNSVCLQAISRYAISTMVPLGSQVSFREIASKTGLSEQMVSRLIRHAITMRIFCEPKPGLVAHTKASKMLVNPVTRDWLSVGTEEIWPAALKGFALANHCSESIYDILGKSPERAARFANAMSVYATGPGYHPRHTVDHFDWTSLGQVQVVDIGGARGHIAVHPARRYSSLNLVIQDIEQVVQGAESGIPDELRDRVTFSAHDMFAPQLIQADVYYFRWTLHNWSDKNCIRILRAQLPALKPGVRIIIQDTCMPELGTMALSNDLDMAATFNARERTPSSLLSIIEVVWDGKL
ncbi:S-adenosyl-L-methionine-dependent methyltransferase [Xylariaceae sp. AK1471]|nr:S-adenosyl-L-methionine-dependent methyltransferase [Xylariaceae sp. AK1471]